MGRLPDRLDRIFATTASRNADFEFDARVAEVFDDMLVRSVPFYLEQQLMIAEIAKKFWVPRTAVYDLGCSTGTLLIHLAREIAGDPRLVGIDNSGPMIERARQKAADLGVGDKMEFVYGDLNGDLADLSLENASVVTLCWTLQFIRPLHRDALIRWVWDSLVDNGVLVVTEKVLTGNSHTNRFFIDLYYDFKRRNGYTETEISRKREALENVLVPYRLEENLELFGRNGFEIADVFFQWYNFAGFLCVKSRAASRR